jgi:hypothetical protein
MYFEQVVPVLKQARDVMHPVSITRDPMHELQIVKRVDRGNDTIQQVQAIPNNTFLQKKILLQNLQ